MEEEESNCIQCQNPMEIDIIIHTIVSYFHRIKDLTSCRKISRKWNSIVSPKLQENIKSLTFKAHPQIRYIDTPEGEWMEYETFTGYPTGSKLQYFIVFLRQNSPGFITFRDFTFIDICLRHEYTEIFLNLYGHLVGTLTLDYRKIELGSIEPTIQKRTEAFMNLLHEQCPNLEKLKIYGKSGPPFLLDQWQPKDIATKCKIKELTLDYEVYNKFVTPHQNFLNGLISCCTSSLQKITLGSRFASPFVDQQEIVDIFLTPIISSCAATLKELNILKHANLGGPTLSTLLRLLSHPQLHLKCLRIHDNVHRGFSNEIRMEVFENPLSTAIELHKSSLEELHLILSGADTPITFPDCMPALKILMISLDPFTPTCKLRSVFHQFPSLKQLVFSTGVYMWPSWERLKFLCENSDPQLKITELRLPCVNSEVLKHGPKLFPNVKVLVIATDPDGIDGIFSWSNLECLHLSVGPRHKKQQFGPTLEEILDGNSPSGKSLRHLKKLKQLTINWIHPTKNVFYKDSEGEFDHFGNIVEPFEMGIITDLSLLNVFSKLPKLEYISIMEHEISKKAATKFLKTGRMKKIQSDGSRFKCQKDYFEQDYVPHKLFPQDEDNAL